MHVEVVTYCRAFRQHLVVGGKVFLVDDILPQQFPVGIALLLILYAERFQVEILSVELIKRDGQILARTRVDSGTRKTHVHC